MPTTKTLPIQTRLARIEPASAQTDDRTLDVVWSSGAQVRRYDWWQEREFFEELDLSGANLDRLNNGAPVLNSHANHDLSNVIGVVERASVQGNEGRATIRLSTRAEVDPIWADIQSGILRNISVGYSIDKLERGHDAAGRDIVRVTHFTPMELSIVAVPADARAQVRESMPEYPVTISEESSMTDEKEATGTPEPESPEHATEPTPTPLDEAAIKAAAVTEERARIVEITRACRAAKLPELADGLIASGVTIDAARKAVIDAWAERGGPEIRGSQETTPTGDFESKVADVMAQGKTRGQAIAAVASAHPDLHRDYLARVNRAA
jgi:phage head maturation protease